MSDTTERCIFEAEWFDNTAGLLKKFYLYFFPGDNTIELFDIKNKKTFLRRTKCQGVSFKNLFIGSVVTIFSRPMKIIDIADEATRSRLSKTMQKTFGLLRPELLNNLGEILRLITAHDLHIANIKMCRLEECDVEKINKNPRMKCYLASKPVVILMLIGDNAINRWNELICLSDNTSGKPVSLRERFAKDSKDDLFYGSPNIDVAEQELNYFFPNSKLKKHKFQNTATTKNCTCCIIKPHAIQQDLIGNIIEDIQKSGYTISALQQFNIDSIIAEEFLEVYKGVLADHGAMVAEFQSGPCVAMEITHKDPKINVPVEFRKFCGPMDPEIGKQVRPNTLRAKYGKTKIQNAVHCSDLPEDGLLEVEYFFRILDG
ncbi:Similar to NME7: Nucleoside diphosphate kinase 7 (Bos taurus) [Cotesia congregata]|uniref:Similar to NME7: Nucleoside diphosphate kinase 7 (Bos taurus) n=1 Tax=Cotesia congregata TaxID=51543 RepID=A0A8J2HHL8_COTCN|nr:Similar to NME7: Nucleoside diphosphate kinase 7 (Bos taurus) [Cotesia congregata]